MDFASPNVILTTPEISPYHYILTTQTQHSRVASLPLANLLFIALIEYCINAAEIAKINPKMGMKIRKDE